MRIRKNRGVAYSGRVGVKLRPKAIPKPAAAVRRFIYRQIRCIGGPLAGGVIKLVTFGDLKTLPIVCKGQAGHYANGVWMEAA